MALETRTNSGSLPFISSSQNNQVPETHEIPIILEHRPKGRPRSNSKVYHNNGENLSSSFVNVRDPSKTRTDTPKPKDQNQAEPQLDLREANGNENKVKKRFERESLVFILSLISLNGTFERKTLKIPEHPSVLKLGRPNNTQRTPTVYNGYFDSRVISREHAEVYMKKGKLFINDLKSANGTFVNQESIHSEKELKVGDVFDLGIDISNDTKHQHQQQQHLKISCKVEGFLSFPLDGVTDEKELLNDVRKDFSKKDVESEDSKPKLSMFDAAMFGDVNNDLEDVELGISHDYLTGIFVNNNIGTSSTLIQSIKSLIDQLHYAKLNNMKLASIETFLQDYKSFLNKDKQLARIGELNQQKSEITKFEAQVAELKETLLLKENDIKQSDQDLQLLKRKINELELENKSLKSTQEDTLSNINDFKKTLNEQSIQIEKFENDKLIALNEHRSQITTLEEKLKAKDDQIESLRKYKEQSIKDEVLLDMAKFSIIFLGVLTIGATTLSYFK